MAWIFGFLGAVSAVLYAIRDESTRAMAAADWHARLPELLAYAAVGFVLGWIAGWALRKIGGDD